MKLFSTTEGIAKLAEDGEFEMLSLTAPDIGVLLADDPSLISAREAKTWKKQQLEHKQIRAPIPSPGAVFCVGANFESHLEEVETLLSDLHGPEEVGHTLAKLKKTPMFFSVPASSITGPYDPIVLPSFASEQIDYEIEIAAIIGIGGKDIPESGALSSIAGLTLANDVSARDIQALAMRGQEFEYGHAKGLDSFKPMGPCLMTTDEISWPIDLQFKAAVNNQVRQAANLSDLIHNIPRCVSYISTFHTLRPGDIVLTGSPSGVGYFQGKFLKTGDIVQMTADKIGRLRNEVVRES